MPSIYHFVHQVVTAMMESGKNLAKDEKKAERCPLLYEWHKKQYVGAAHGLAGIYYTLMQVRRNLSLSVSLSLSLFLSLARLLFLSLSFSLSLSLFLSLSLSFPLSLSLSPSLSLSLSLYLSLSLLLTYYCWM